MTGKLVILATTALLVAAGCSIPLEEEQLSLQNLCSSDSDCPSGSLCRDVNGATLCVSTTLDLPPITFEVRPVLGGGASQPSLLDPIDLAGKGGQLHLDLSVPQPIDVSPGRVYLPCAADAAVPAKVTFLPVAGMSGLLADQKYEADSMLDDTGAFHVSVPPGTYDIYIEPHPDLAANPDCAGAPPIFIPKWEISKDSGFAIHASAPLYVTGSLKLSQKEDFTKWFLEVVEPFGARTISEVVQPKQDGIALEVPFAVRFDWTVQHDPKHSFTPVIRLRPPQDSGKPIIHWSLDGVALGGQIDQDIPVALDVSGIDTQPREVSGPVLHDGQPVVATVTLHSKNIPGSDLNRFETVVETDDAGSFQALLPRGEYMVIARPHSQAFAIGFTTWDIREGAGCFCGNSVEVPSATTLAGSVTTPGGQLTDADIRLTPTAAEVEAFLGNTSVIDVPPRPASASTLDGQFQVTVDAGTFDLSIIPPPDAGYPWLVRPRQEVTMPTTSAAPVVSLQPFALQPPAVVSGVARGPDGAPLSGATIRAWVGVEDPNASGSVPSAVQIASTVAAADGSYVLLLPSSIKQGK